MFIGYMGDVVFTASESMLRTPSNFQRSGGSRWEQHDLILAKPVAQFAGPALERVSFRIILSSAHGVNPSSELRKLRRMRDSGAVFPVIIGGRPLTQNYWRLDSLSEGTNYYDAYGHLIQSTADVSLVEYDDSNYMEELSRLDQYGAVYNIASTLMGGF